MVGIWTLDVIDIEGDLKFFQKLNNSILTQLVKDMDKVSNYGNKMENETLYKSQKFTST